MTDDKRGVGRPSLFRNEYVQQAFRLSLLGMTDEEMAKFFGVAPSTFSLWKIEYPELSEAISNGKERADSEIAFKLFDRARGATWQEEQAIKVKVGKDMEQVQIVTVTKEAPPDTKAAIMWLKNRQKKKWRDTIDHTTDGEKFDNTIPPVFNIMPVKVADDDSGSTG